MKVTKNEHGSDFLGRGPFDASKPVKVFDSGFFSAKGKEGGNITKERHGVEHYRRISKLAIEKRWGKKNENNRNGEEAKT